MRLFQKTSSYFFVIYSVRVCFFKIIAAVFTSTAIPSQMIQLDNAPEENMNVSVHPRSAAKAHAAKAYAENTAGPINTATSVPNC